MAKMTKMTLVRLPISALLELREQVDQRLHEHRGDIVQQLRTIEQAAVELPIRRGRSSPLSGSKIAPKYRGPAGETWSGRGERPRWLTAALRGGKKKIDDFLIDKPARKKRRKRKKVAARKKRQPREATARRKKQKRKTAARKHRRKRQTMGRKKQHTRNAMAPRKQQKRGTKILKQMLPATNDHTGEASQQRLDNPIA
jgi:DNA-binding protein H-NS